MTTKGKLLDAKRGVALKRSDVLCIDDHLLALWDAKRPTKREIRKQIRYIMEHFTGELRGKM